MNYGTPYDIRREECLQLCKVLRYEVVPSTRIPPADTGLLETSCSSVLNLRQRKIIATSGAAQESAYFQSRTWIRPVECGVQQPVENGDARGGAPIGYADDLTVIVTARMIALAQLKLNRVMRNI